MLIHETPVELINVPKTGAGTLGGQLKDCMLHLALPISQCRGQAYDGAATMKGHIRGVAAIIQQAEPRALYVHCIAHCTNLCLQTAVKTVSLFVTSHTPWLVLEALQQLTVNTDRIDGGKPLRN